MNYLVDTHILLWLSGVSPRLPTAARTVIEDIENTVFFSTVSIWEVAIKTARRQADFMVDPVLLRDNLLDNQYRELPVLGDHALMVMNLPDIHRDPFDRMLLAQARVENLTVITADRTMARYGRYVQLV